MRRFSLLLALCVLGGPAVARAGPFVVDQSNPYTCATGCGGHNIGFFAPIGQTFTPTLTAMDAIEVWVSDFTGSTTTSSTARMTIRQGGILGPSLGFVDLVVPNTPSGNRFVIHFDFPTPIALVPGNLYAWDIDLVAGDTVGLGLWGASTGYAGGGGYLTSNGNTVPTGEDFFFVQGLHAIPEPLTLTLFGAGLAAVGLWRARRA